MMNKPLIICLMGPTASGKTHLALQLVERFPCEIISVDSAMIYRGMNIGTAKPDEAILKKIPHHLVNCCDVVDTYSVGQFCQDAVFLINQIIARQKIPLLVGGTMMYFKSLLKGFATLPARNETIRATMNARIKKEGLNSLYCELKSMDPKSCKTIHPNDRIRIIRALEVMHLTGTPLSILQTDNRSILSPFQVMSFALTPQDREQYYRQIAARFDSMIDAGLIDEVKQLQKNVHLTRDHAAMHAVGYRQVWDYLAGLYDEKEMRKLAITRTRQLAKHQLTWLRTFQLSHLLVSEDYFLLDKIIQQVEEALLATHE